MGSDWDRLVERSALDLQGRHVAVENTSLDALAHELGITDHDIDSRGDFRPWSPTDIAIGIIAGLAGAFASYALSDPLAKIHDGVYSQRDHSILGRVGKFLDHSGSPMDATTGKNVIHFRASGEIHQSCVIWPGPEGAPV